MRFHAFFIFLLIKMTVNASELGNKISDYFEDGRVKSLRSIWNKQRKAFENSVATDLKRAYSMNVYENTPTEQQNIIDGYLVNDNIVKVLFAQMILREAPLMLLPEVSFPLDHNLIRVESTLGKIFLDSHYLLYRNTSQILYTALPQDNPYRHSPFGYQQIQREGFVTIVAEGCHMIIQSIVSMVGLSVRVGSTTVKLVKCHFTVEVFSPGLSAPPIISPYFSPQQAKDIQMLLANSQLQAMSTRLQGVMTSIVNTTGFLGLTMPKHRKRQQRIIKETTDFMTLVARKMNILTSRAGDDVDSIKDVVIKLDEVAAEPDGFTRIAFTEMTVNGLNDIYASKRGGPCVMSTMRVVEVFRYNRLQVRGKLSLTSDAGTSTYTFSVQLTDVGVFVTLNVAEAQRRGGRGTHGRSHKGTHGRTHKGTHGRSHTGTHGRSHTGTQGRSHVVSRFSDYDEDAEEWVSGDSGDENDNTVNNDGTSQHRFGYRGWRNIKLAIFDWLSLENHEHYKELLTGILHNSVPGIIIKHFNKYFDSAVENAEKDGGYKREFETHEEQNDSDADSGESLNSDDDNEDDVDYHADREAKKLKKQNQLKAIYIPGRSNKRSRNSSIVKKQSNKL